MIPIGLSIAGATLAGVAGPVSTLHPSKQAQAAFDAANRHAERMRRLQTPKTSTVVFGHPGEKKRVERAAQAKAPKKPKNRKARQAANRKNGGR